MSSFALWIRDRYHPLFHLRKFKFFQTATHALDIPVAYKIAGVDHKIFISLSKNLSLILAGTYTEKQEQENFIKTVKYGNFKSFFDVGANIGYYGFLFGTLVPDSKIVMVEPDKTNSKLLRKTISNFAPKVTLIESAASDTEGTIDFFIDEVSGSTGSIGLADKLFVAKHHKMTPKKITVTATTIDILAAQFGAPDFIKIDVESAELKVLQGALNLIRNNHPAVFFECDSSDAKVSEIFLSNGYAIFDFESLRRTDSLRHNNLALHLQKHANLISSLESQRNFSKP